MNIGFWCPINDAVLQKSDDLQESTWTIVFPAGWHRTTITAGLIRSNTDHDLDGHSLSIDVLMDGLKVGSIATSKTGERKDLLTGSFYLGPVSNGQHKIGVLCSSKEAKPEGIWITNGPLTTDWPGNHPALEVDRLLQPFTTHVVPQPSWTTHPLEWGEPGIFSHINQQALIGVGRGKVTAIPASLRLRYVDSELNIFLQTKEGYRRVKDVCPDFHFSLLDGYLPCPIAHFIYEDVHYEIGFAAIPEGEEAAEMVRVTAKNESKSPKPNAVRLLLDGSEGLTIKDTTVTSSGEVIAYLSPAIMAQTKTRPIGCADLKATVASHAWATPFMEPQKYPWDLSFLSGRIGWEGQPIRYCLRCQPGARFTIYIGLAKIEWGNPSQKPILAGEQVVLLKVDGVDQAVPVDCRTFPGFQANFEIPEDAKIKPDPQVFRFNAWDQDGDGIITIESMPDPSVPNSIGVMSAIWVFPADQSVNTVELHQGKFNSEALYYINVGATSPLFYIDLIAGDDWSSTYTEIASNNDILPGQTQEFCLALPVNHRPEMMCYSQARPWKEPNEGTPTFKKKLVQRHAAARLAVEAPERALDAVRHYWAQILNYPAGYKVPESTVLNLVRTSYCYFHIQSQKNTDNHLLFVGGGPMFYYDFSERDYGYDVTSVDFTGQHHEAELYLNHYLTRWDELNSYRWTLGQDDNGMWMTRRAEEDTQGQVLWALGEHFMLTRDITWLKRAWPWIKRGLDYIRRKRDEQNKKYPDPEDPRHGLWLAGVDESKTWGVTTHSYYFSYWIECALRFGVIEAEALGEDAYALVLREEYADFRSCLRKSLRKTYFRFDHRRGVLPDTAEKPGNFFNVWGAQESVWPSNTLEPFDPMVTQTLAYLDSLAYPRTGGFPFGIDQTWATPTGDYAMMHLRRGEADHVVDCFYSMISTCGTVNSWCEMEYFSNGLGTGEQPYLWGNSTFLVLFRHMLLHEEGDWLRETPSGPDELWICPATPRKWLDDPEGIAVENAPSYFGPVSFTIRYDADRGSSVTRFHIMGDKLPKRVVVHLRTLDGRPIRRATVNGSDHPYFRGDQVIIANPPSQCEILAWV